MCYAIDGPLFAAASESVALVNLGFPASSVQSLEPASSVVGDRPGSALGNCCHVNIRAYTPQVHLYSYPDFGRLGPIVAKKIRT